MYVLRLTIEQFLTMIECQFAVSYLNPLLFCITEKCTQDGKLILNLLSFNTRIATSTQDCLLFSNTLSLNSTIAIILLFFNASTTFCRPQMSDLRGDQKQVLYNSYIVGRKLEVEKNGTSFGNKASL